MDFIFRYAFLGFVGWTLIWALVLRRNVFTSVTNDRLDLIMVRIAQALGVVHIISIFIGFYNRELNIDRMFNEYWFGFWIYTFTYFGLTQLLFFKSIRNSKILRLLIAVCIFCVLFMETFIIFIADLHRDYAPR
jgi:hypothetical protein